jgi:hypothetical protein
MQGPPEKKPKLTDVERHKRFVETAKKVEASDEIIDFDNAFDKIIVPTKDAQRSSKTTQR